MTSYNLTRSPQLKPSHCWRHGVHFVSGFWESEINLSPRIDRINFRTGLRDPGIGRWHEVVFPEPRISRGPRPANNAHGPDGMLWDPILCMQQRAARVEPRKTSVRWTSRRDDEG